MKAANLENDYANFSLLDLSNYKHLHLVGKQENLMQYSSSDISTPEKSKDYVEIA